jgi:hypothetical protein
LVIYSIQTKLLSASSPASAIYSPLSSQKGLIQREAIVKKDHPSDSRPEDDRYSSDSQEQTLCGQSILYLELLED